MNYLIGNWKMNPQTREEAVALATMIAKGVQRSDNSTVVICPPFVWLDSVASALQGSAVMLGAQNVFYAENGTYTGEISPSMLKSIGVSHVLVGHSERRIHIGEDDRMINKKLHACLMHGLAPVLLIGDETSQTYHGLGVAEREREREMARMREQLEVDLEDIREEDLGRILFVYEPVWAISEGAHDKADHSANPTLVHDYIGDINSMIGDIFEGAEIEFPSLSFLCGGSANKENIEAFMRQKTIKGVVPGGASLRAEEFIHMSQVMSRAT